MRRGRLAQGLAGLEWAMARALEAPVKEACAAVFAAASGWGGQRPPAGESQPVTVGIVVQEYFDPRLGGFGGFGMTTRLLVEHLRAAPDGFRPLVILPQDLGLTKRPELREVDGTPVLMLPSLARLLRHPLEAARIVRELRLDLLITIDYLTKYEYALWLAPRVPLLLYLGDPRGPREWERIATVPLERQAHRRPGRWALVDIARQHRTSFRRLRRWSGWLGRPVLFATDCRCLVARAREKLAMPDLEAYDLPNPLNLPAFHEPRFSERPSLLFMGRLEPQKRPWIAYELARRLPEVEFVVAGPSPQPDLMDPVLARHGLPPNLRRVGVVVGAAKERLFDACWALLNTSVHEGLPVTFLEAFSHAKCVISSVDPDDLVSKFGYPVGDVLGDGLDEASLSAFEGAIRRCLADEQGRRERGLGARRMVEDCNTPEAFLRALRAILAAEGLPVAAVGSPGRRLAGEASRVG